MNVSWPQAAALVVVAGLVLVGSAPAVSAQSTQEAFVVDLEADGSAQITVRSVFDLDADAEQEAFRALETDEAARDDAAARFEARLGSVASDAENATGRSMAVTDAAIELERVDNTTGVVTMTATWTGLAEERDGELVVTEPFASGFSPDRRFTVRAPDGYEFETVTPAPDDRTESSATWQAGSALDGFDVVLTPSEADGTDAAGETTDTDGQPGFGVTTVVVSVVLAVLLGARRR